MADENFVSRPFVMIDKVTWHGHVKGLLVLVIDGTVLEKSARKGDLDKFRPAEDKRYSPACIQNLTNFDG